MYNIKSFQGCQVLIFIFGCFCPVIYAHASLIEIRSGGSWAATSGNPGSDWMAVDYDASGWGSAFSPYPNDRTTPEKVYNNIEPGSYAGDRTAELMWYWEDAIPDPVTGRDGELEAYFRYEFFLPPPGYAAIEIEYAPALVIADDYFDLYINGSLVDTPDNNRFLDENLTEDPPPGDIYVQPIPIALDLLTACPGGCLQFGGNVISIYAYDGYKSGPQDRLYESVFFHSDIQYKAVPEPDSIALFLLGLLGIGFVVKSSRKTLAADL